MKTLAALFVVLSPIWAAAQVKNSASSFTAITHVNVIDVTGSTIQSNMTVVIEGNRIIALDKTAKVPIPKNAVIINATGKYLIPGLWDMHFHTFQSLFKSDYRFRLCIANGVTGIREMWTKMDEMEQVTLWRKQFYDSTGTIPRFGAAGTMVDGVPSVQEGSDTASTVAGARLLVQRIKASGSDFIKVYNNLSREVYFAIADESKKQNIPFVGHLPYSILLKEATEAGQQSLEHLTGNGMNLYFDCPSLEKMVNAALSDSIVAAGLPPVAIMQEGLELCDEKKAFVIFQRLAEKDVWQCPTLVLLKAIHRVDENLLFNDPRMKYIPLLERQRWETRTGDRLKKRSLEAKDKDGKCFERAMAIISPMKKAGIRFLAGSDIPNHYLYSGFSLHDELALFVEAGLTPMEAIQTATINPAIFLGAADSLGSIEKGKIADLVLLVANPLTDIHNTQMISAVIVNGKYLSKKVLQQMLHAVEITSNKK